MEMLCTALATPMQQIDRDLERLVHLLPPDHLDRIRGAGEQRADRVVIDRVALLLELLDLASPGRSLRSAS